MNRKRKPFVAGLLSLVVPGLGQMYNGQLLKAILLYLLLGAAPFSLFLLNQTFWVLPALMGLIVIIYLYAILDAVIVAVRRRNYRLKPYNRSYYYIATIGIAFVLTQVIDMKSMVGMKAFIIDGPSMHTTFKTNDRVIVDTKAGKYEDGDIIVYKYKDRMMVHRIVASAGDTVEIKHKKLLFNGESRLEPYISNEEYFQDIAAITVPNNSYYVLGDNRAEALDSRYQGAIPVENIVGKVLYIYYSDDTKVIGRKL